MSYGTYKDPHIQLKDTFLLQYELGREVPALIQLFAENTKDYDIQWRTVMTRVVGAIAGRRKGKVADSHYQPVRELGLRMIELPDGSGELMCL